MASLLQCRSAFGPQTTRFVKGPRPPQLRRMDKTIRLINRQVIATVFLGLALSGGEAGAQAFGSGPPGTPTGSSMSGARIVGQPKPSQGRRIPNAKVFGDRAEERAYGKDFDDSYIRPKVRTGIRSGRSNEETATQGQSNLDGVNSGAFARQGPTAIGRSAVTHGSSRGSHGGRARIVRPAAK